MDFQKKITRNSKLAICPECSQQFIFKDYLKKKKQPLLIGCGHSACESCIRSAVTAKRDIVCKFCGFTKPFEPEMADDLQNFFPIDQFTVGRLIRGSSIGIDNSVEFRKNVKKTQASTKKKCSECSTRVEEVKCKQCDVPYCEDCFDSVHGSARSLKSHEKLPLPIDVTQIRTSIEVVPCPQHNDVNQDFYCKTCSLQLCSRCALLSHGQHEIVLLYDQNKLKQKSLNEALEKANRIYKRLQFTKKKAQASLSSPDQSTITDYSQVKSEISMHFQRLHGLLQIRENYLLNLVSNLENYQINSLHDVIDQLSTSLSDAEVVLREAREAMRPEKFKLIDANIILRSLQEVCSMPCFLLPSDYSETNDEDNTEKMVLKFMVDDKVDATLKDYGMLTTPSRTKFVLKSEEDLPADYRADPVPEEMELEPFLLDDHHSVSSAGGGRGAGGGSVGGGGGDTRMSASLSDISASSSSVRVLDMMYTRRDPPFSDAGAESPAHPPDAPIWMLKTGCPRNDLSPGTIEEVMMSHIMSPSLFYVHRKRVSFYMEQIRRLIGRALHTRAPPTEVKPGWIYLAKYSADNRWYRAKVIKFYDANKIHAQFIDFGNDEYITLANIEYSTEKIQEIPALATACKLHLCKPSPGPEWDPSAIKIMAAMCKTSSTLRMQVMENKSGSGRPVEVELRCFLGGTSSLLRDTLFFHGFATHTSTTNYTQLKSLMLQSQCLTRTNTHKPGTAFDGVVTYIKDPSNFYVNTDMIFYDRLMCELNTYYRHPSQTGPKFFYPSKGLAVAVFDEQQCGWFRAKVTGHPGNQTVELFYVDIGQTAVVKWEAIRVLEDKFLRAHQLAVKCELYNVVPITGSGWPAAANEEFRKMALGQMVRVNVVEENPTCLSVVLYRTINLQEVCINGQLIEQELAASASIISPFSNHRGRKALLPTPPGKKKSFEQVITKPGYKSARTRKYRSLEAQIGPATSIRAAAVSPKPMTEEEKEKEDAEDEHLIMHENRFPCTIIKIIDPSHFHVTFYSEMLEKLKQDITKFYLNESNREKYKREEEWKKGDNCVFQNKDRAWYRATIQSISDDKAELLVKDIMEEVTVATTELYNVKENFNVMDRLFRCHLVGVRAPGDRGVWPSISTEEFEKQVTTRGKVYFSQKGEVDEKRQSIPAVLSLKTSVEEVGALEPAVSEWYTVNELLVDMGLALPDSHIQDRLFKQQTLLESLMGTKNISPKGDTTTAKHADEKSEGSVKSESETSSSLLSSGAISKKKKESKNKKQASQYVTPDISDWLPPEPLHSLKFDTSASYVDMDANIYIQDTTSADTLRIIGATLQSKYENSRPSPHDSFWSAGQLCVAKYHADQKWYRGKVMEVLADNRYRVVMVDYGNVEEVKAADMRKNLLMTQVPRQCHPCALKRVKPLSDDGKWPITVLDQIHGYVVDRQCAVELAGTCGDYSVVDIEVLPGESLIGLLIRLNCAVLTDTNGNARDDDDDDDSSSSSSSCSSEEVLIEKEIEAATTDDSDAKKSAVSTKSSDDQESETMANQVRICETIPPTFADLTIDEPNPNPAALKSSWLDIMEEEQNKALIDQYRVIEPRYKPLVIPPHIEEIEVEATAIISATTFFGLVTETADVKMKRVEFTKMQAEMQEIAQDLPLIEMPTEKQVCCSKFQHDGYWYRAEILKVKDKTCILKFVDYGNCECISINEIHELKPEWLNIPIQGALMTLYNVRMAPNVDVKDCAKALNKCIFDKTLTAKIKNYNPLLVEVFTQDGKSVNEELTSQPFYMQID